MQKERKEKEGFRGFGIVFSTDSEKDGAEPLEASGLDIALSFPSFVHILGGELSSESVHALKVVEFCTEPDFH